MDFMRVLFPVSGVDTYLFVPPIFAFVVAFFGSMGGVSGAFLVLPFQMSVLGYTAPSVSSTNFVYNIVAIPSGVYKYIREGRMFWPLSWLIIIGTLPGVFMGYFIRVRYLPEPRNFKIFVGMVLLYLGVRLITSLRGDRMSMKTETKGAFRVEDVHVSLLRVEFTFAGRGYAFGTVQMFVFSLIVGTLGGAYGIGGGAIIAPFCVAVLGLPVYAVAGAALLGTFITSIAGVAFYSIIPSTLSTAPDWALGALFGAGGLAGMYLGARLQRHMPQRFIKLLLGGAILYISFRYISLLLG